MCKLILTKNNWDKPDKERDSSIQAGVDGELIYPPKHFRGMNIMMDTELVVRY